jgi:glycosyltransferase involved in cell wall biosynthesis
MKIQVFGSDIFDKLKNLLDDLQLNDFIQLPRYLPHQKAIEQIMRSHVLLLTIIKKTDEEVISSKIFEYLASGKKILLVSRGGAVADLIRSTKRGIVVSPDSTEDIKNAIRSFLLQYEKNNLKMAPPIAMNQFDRKFLAKDLAQLFDQLISEK